MQMSCESSPAGASDTELLARFAARGDDPAFAELVRRHLPLVLAVTRRRLGGSGLAEDAAQQVFIALSVRVRKARQIPCLAAWLQKAAVYEAANIARREKRHRKRAEQSQDLWSEEAPVVSDRSLDEALAALAERDRQVLLLHHYEKLSYEQIGGRLRISPGAAQRCGHRALAKLAELLKRRGSERSEAACVTWLAAGLAPENVRVSAELLAKTSVAKKATGLSIPWLPVAAVLLLGGGAVVTVRMRPPEGPVAAALEETVAVRQQNAVRQREPQTPDEKLTPEIREFIARAKRNPKDAWDWAKARPGWQLLLSDGSRALADRDLPAADRLLEVVEGREGRSLMIAAIFTSRTEANFESAIVWIDTFAESYEKRAAFRSSSRYINTEDMDHDYAGTLGIARSPEVRHWLITEACEKAANLDEHAIEELARGLKGEDRRIALGHAASVLLQRGDPRAFEILDEGKPDAGSLPELDRIALRDPQAVLDWALSQTDGRDRGNLISTLWHHWSKRDAEAAVAWARKVNRETDDIGKKIRPMDAVAERLMKEEP